MNDDQEKTLTVMLKRKQGIKALQVLQGLLIGFSADGVIHDKEIQFLSTWLADNVDATKVWPGSAIYLHIKEILADGVVTHEERIHMLQVIQTIIGNDFNETGSTGPDSPGVPFDAHQPTSIGQQKICLTGEFLYGTRADCEKISEKAGAICMSAVSGKLHMLIVGANVSPYWISTSYGRKIQAAMELKSKGKGPYIISEQSWLQTLHNS